MIPEQECRCSIRLWWCHNVDEKNKRYFQLRLLVRITTKVDWFQCSLFLGIITTITWLKSTLLLKNKCFDTHIYMKTQCLQTNKTQHYCGKENAWEAGWVRRRIALIKNLIYARKKRRAWSTFVRDRAEIVSWYWLKLNLFLNKNAYEAHIYMKTECSLTKRI